MSTGPCLPPYFLLLMIFPVEQLQYRFPVNDVDSCPTTNQSWYRAGVRLNCSHDVKNRFQYLCIPNQDKTALLEFCYDRIMGLYEEGHCLHLSNSGILNQDNCTSFKEGCPPKPYFSSEIFLFQKCLSINTEFGCFQEDSYCSLKNQTKMTKGIGNITTPETTDDRSDAYWIMLLVTGSLIIIAIVAVLSIKLYSRRIQRARQENIELLPKEKRDRHVDVCQSMQNLCFKHRMDITWEKDGRQIKNDDRHSSEVDTDSSKVDTERRFIIYNVNEEDTGYYKGVTKRRRLKTHPVYIEIEILHLHGPVNIYIHGQKNEQKTHPVRPSQKERILNLICCSCASNHQNVSKDENSCWRTIWSSRANKDNPCYVLVTKSNNTSNSSHNMFTNDAEKKLLFHVALLLSKKRSLQRNSEEAKHCFNVSEQFFPDFLEQTTFDECFLASNRWVDSISMSQDTATFVSDEVEMLTLWALLQNCRVPKNVIEYMFDNRLTYLCVKYFRLHGYKRHENETCIYVPPSLEDKYLECLIEDYISKLNDDIKCKSVIGSEDYDQRSSSLLKCIMYCCFIIKKGSKELISKYFRTTGYQKIEDKRSICVPEDVTRNLIKRLEIDIVIHQTICDTSCHQAVSEIFRIPEEILKWDLEARQRFLKKFKSRNVPVYRARCMIVGCTGAGKTTLLRHLQRKENKKSRQSPESTKGIDVYENLFIIKSSKDDKKWDLNDYEKQSIFHVGCFKNCRGKKSDDHGFLSVMDFAGQVAYYACHQVYFSRRAIYVLVVDMSKDLTADIGSIDGHNVRGSLFERWSMKDYFAFWLQTIRTYSEDISPKDTRLGKDESRNASSPVIVVATHKDCMQNAYREYDSGKFHEQLLKSVPKTIQDFFNDGSHKYFELELPQKEKTTEQLEAIEDVRRCIARTAISLPHWGEQIPATWLQFEKIIQEKKEMKILTRDEITKLYDKDDDLDDMLRFYHEAGVILFFPDEHLRNTIILDIQWFVDSFKYIITDETHISQTFRLSKKWNEYSRSGMLPESLMLDIWREVGSENGYVRYKDKITPYMEKLGIMAKRKILEGEGELYYYIPSVNKLDLQTKDFIEKGNYTSILTFYFKSFLPHFFFYRLVVVLFGIWKPAGDDLLMKNAAIFDSGEEDEYHHIVAAVNTTSIQIQVYTRAKTIPLKVKKIIEIRKQVEIQMHEITSTFHRQAEYEIGFHCPCKSVKITEEDEESFIPEKKLLMTKMREIPCPNHHKHCAVLNKEDILACWTKNKYNCEHKCSSSPERQEETTRDECTQRELDPKTVYPKAKFRKEEDGCLKVKDQESFYLQMWHQSIGLLKCRTTNGTAFRVGKRYLMTAYHVIKDTVDFYLEKFIEFAQSDPTRKRNFSKLLIKLQAETSGADVEMKIRNGIESWLKQSVDKIPFSDLVEALDVSGFSLAKDQASKLMNDFLMSVNFSCKKGQDQALKYLLKCDIPFYSETNDVALLEVSGRDFSCPPFALDISKKKPYHVHIVGYPSTHDSEEILDPNCRLISSKESWTQYEEAVQWWKDKCPNEDISKFKNAYDKAFSGDGKIQLNCSESTTHGASGSPGLILSDEEKPKVFLMLQEGFPSFAYGDEYKDVLKIIPKKYLVESGISMSRVYLLLSEKRFLELRNEIFHT